MDAFLRERVDRYFVKTIDAPDNRALGFYLDNGFERIARLHEAGRDFAVFEKRFEPA